MVGGAGAGRRAVRPHYSSSPPPLPLFCYISLLDLLNMKHLFCWQLILILLYLTSAWMFFFHTLATAFPTSWHIKTFCSCLVWKASNNSSLLNIVSSASLLTQSDWMEKKANQSFCIRKKAWEEGWCPQRRWQDVKLSAMCKCVQKRSALLKWDLLI